MAKAFLTAPVESAGDSAPNAGWHYGYGEFDETTKRVKHFTPFAFFTGGQWQVGRDFPDKEFGHLLLRAEGGHPGQSQARSAIRRWVAPRDGTVTVSGALSHANAQGDGVRARIVSSRAGILAEAVAQNGSAELKVVDLAVQAGDTVDFIADCRANSNSDSFSWAPKVKFIGASARSSKLQPGFQSEWDAKADFGKPKDATATTLTPWEKLAHTLLISNELAFVD